MLPTIKEQNDSDDSSGRSSVYQVNMLEKKLERKLMIMCVKRSNFNDQKQFSPHTDMSILFLYSCSNYRCTYEVFADCLGVTSRVINSSIVLAECFSEVSFINHQS